MVGLTLYIFSLFIAAVGSIYLLAHFLSKKDFFKALVLVLICFAVSQISYGYGVKSVDVRSEHSYFQPTKKLLNHFADLLNVKKNDALNFKIKYINEQIADKRWRDNSSYQKAVEQTINKKTYNKPNAVER